MSTLFLGCFFLFDMLYVVRTIELYFSGGRRFSPLFFWGRRKIWIINSVIPEVFNREYSLKQAISPIEAFGDDRKGFSE